LGKTTTSEFACSFDPVSTINPLNPYHTPGGSSCGSAVAVATGMCFAALGTQVAGSTLQPSAYCGVVGFKPTINIFPTTGIFSSSPSLDHVGFITRKIEDMSVVLETLLDSNYSTFVIKNYMKRNIDLGYPREWITSISSNETIKVFDDLIQMFSKYPRIRIVDIPMPCPLKEILDIQLCIMQYELFGIHKSYINFPNPTINYQSKTLFDMISCGQNITQKEYEAAIEMRAKLFHQIEALFGENRLLLSPAVPDLAPKKDITNGDPRLCVPWSLFGFPSICFPVRIKPHEPNDLLHSIQIVGKPKEDYKVLKVAHQLNICMIENCSTTMEETDSEE